MHAQFLAGQQKDPKALIGRDVMVGAFSNIVASADTTWTTRAMIADTYFAKGPSLVPATGWRIPTKTSSARIRVGLVGDAAAMNTRRYLFACERVLFFVSTEWTDW
jgi:hypothetical protein